LAKPDHLPLSVHPACDTFGHANTEKVQKLDGPNPSHQPPADTK
jgi:hypothetical protein